MYENLAGKKLLVIGSAETEANIVNAAHELGVYVVACDGIAKSENTFAKNIADESWDIDYSKTELMVKKCRENSIDGVMAGYSDNRVCAAQQISEALGTPFYASRYQLELTRNKRLFKDECVKHGITVPHDYCISGDKNDIDLTSISYPVIVKPTDNGGRKGINICKDSSELDSAINEALSASKSKSIVVEEYVEGTEFAAIYTLSNGEYRLSCFNEKYPNVNKGEKSILCDLALTPSRQLEVFSETDMKIKSFLKGIGAKDGVASFQGIFNRFGFWIFELGYRLNGGNDYSFIETENGISYMKMLISHSLTGDMGDDVSKNNPHFKQFHSNYMLYASEGVISEIDYIGTVGKNGVDDVHISLAKGTKIKGDGTTAQKAFSFKLSASSIDGIVKSMKYVNEHSILTDENGDSMFLDFFDPNRFRK